MPSRKGPRKSRPRFNPIGAYLTLTEALNAHQRLTVENITPIAELDSLSPTGKFSVRRAEYVKCGLERNGKVCRQKHGNGYIVARSNLDEGFVGWCCYQDYLRFHDDFVSRVNKLEAGYVAEDFRQRVAELLADTARVSRIESLATAHAQLEARLFQFRSLLPQRVLLRLEQIQKQASHEVAIEWKRWKRDKTGDYAKNEHGSPIIERRRESLGYLAGLGILNEARRRQLSQAVHAIVESLDEARAMETLQQKRFDHWSKTFDTLAATEANFERFRELLAAFEQQSNLDRLYCVGHQVYELPETFVAISALLAKPMLIMATAEDEAARWERAILNRFSCDEFRWV